MFLEFGRSPKVDEGCSTGSCLVDNQYSVFNSSVGAADGQVSFFLPPSLFFPLFLSFSLLIIIFSFAFFVEIFPNPFGDRCSCLCPVDVAN